ncbi:MAG: distal tail protein Dit [Eubacteriales bacterium]
MIGFTFRNIHSSNFKIGAKSIDRSIIPAKRKNEFVIPGRHGTIDFGNHTYETRPISVEIGLIRNSSFGELRESARQIAKWLSGEGLLIFDDEPDKAYQASVYDYIGIEQIELMPAGRLNVVFECQPFAESLEYRQVNVPSITDNAYEIKVNVSGTAETCCIITIKNNGTSDINNITLIRKVEV